MVFVSESWMVATWIGGLPSARNASRFNGGPMMPSPTGPWQIMQFWA